MGYFWAQNQHFWFIIKCSLDFSKIVPEYDVKKWVKVGVLDL